MYRVIPVLTFDQKHCSKFKNELIYYVFAFTLYDFLTSLSTFIHFVSPETFRVDAEKLVQLLFEALFIAKSIIAKSIRQWLEQC